jgi:L-lysine exporter family protein LysE/ArgO
MGLGGGLIVAIGAQNAFLLRQGLQGRHVLACAAVCLVCDTLLIALGASSVGRLIGGDATLLLWLRYGGALFLLEYGRRAAVAAWRPQAGDRVGGATAARTSTLTSALRQAAGLSLLNPHAWLDTVVLLGAIGAQQRGQGPLVFSAGAMAASGLWFGAIGLGAPLLAPLFSRPRAWRTLDALVAMTMWGLAASLIVS